MTRYLLPAIMAPLTLGACANSDLEDAEQVKTWVTTGSAVSVWSNTHDVIAFADGEGPFADPACPATSDDGTTVTIAGGCTDTDGEPWVGTATVVRGAGEDQLDATLDDFGNVRWADQTTSGTVAVRAAAGGGHEFTTDIVIEGGMTTRISYDGTVEGDWDTPETVWSGEGTVEREGVLAPTGRVHVVTIDEVVNDGVCSGQPVSGRTTVSAAGHFATATYDGQTDCDDEKTVAWTFDGEPQGRISGINCTVGRGGGTAPALSLGALVLVLVARRRRTRPR